MNNEQQAELERLERVLAVAKRNGNELFIQNIEREISAVQRGEHSPLIEEYLTADCLLYTSPSPRDKRQSRMPSSA